MTLYAAKCYWPEVSQADLEQVGARAARSDRGEATYRGSLLFAADDLVLCLFDAPSRAAVKRASGRLGVPCERVMDSTWVGPSRLAMRGATG